MPVLLPSTTVCVPVWLCTMTGGRMVWELCNKYSCTKVEQQITFFPFSKSRRMRWRLESLIRWHCVVEFMPLSKHTAYDITCGPQPDQGQKDRQLKRRTLERGRDTKKPTLPPNQKLRMPKLVSLRTCIEFLLLLLHRLVPSSSSRSSPTVRHTQPEVEYSGGNPLKTR